MDKFLIYLFIYFFLRSSFGLLLLKNGPFWSPFMLKMKNSSSLKKHRDGGVPVGRRASSLTTRPLSSPSARSEWREIQFLNFSGVFRKKEGQNGTQFEKRVPKRTQGPIRGPYEQTCCGKYNSQDLLSSKPEEINISLNFE